MAQGADAQDVPVDTAVVIGTGFGGAVTACRLAQASRVLAGIPGRRRLRVIVLERGRRYGPQDFPRLQLPEAFTDDRELRSSQRVPDFARFSWRQDFGLWDLRNLGDLMVAQAAGVGGGSLVYANVLLRAPSRELDHWPERYRAAELEPYYALVESMLGAEVAPEKYDKTKVFRKAVVDAGKDSDTDREPFLISPPLAIRFAGQEDQLNRYGRKQNPCNGCGDCTIGCARQAKNTLDLNYLASAENDGARIRTLAEVTTVERTPDNRFRIHYLDHHRGGSPEELEAHYVFLGAGAIGSTEILLRSREALQLGEPAQNGIGSRFFANGDSLGVVFDGRKSATPWSGPTITRALVHKEGNLWFMIQDGGIPPTLRRALGFLRSGMWLGRNRFGQPTSPSSMPVEAPARSLVDLFTKLPSVLGSVRPPAQGKSDVVWAWDRLLPLEAAVLIKRVIDPAGTLRRELDALGASVLKTVQAELARKTLGRTLLPTLLDIVDRPLLLGAVVKAIQERFPGLGRLLKTSAVGGSGFAFARYLLLGGEPGPHTSMLLSMGPDHVWKLEEKRDRLRAKRDAAGSMADVALYGAQERLMRDLAKAMGGELRTNPGWTVGRRPVSVHAQGGCSMRTTRAAGQDGAAPVVTEDDGGVRGVDGLYVMDAAAFPSSVGVNPALTIAAVAESKVEHFIQNRLGLGNWSSRAMEDERPPQNPPAPPYVAVAAPNIEALLQQACKAAKQQPVGIKWREHMEGSFAPWEGNPPGGGRLGLMRAAESSGRAGGCRVVADFGATVNDLDRFLIEATPVVSITGTIKIRQAGDDQEYDCTGQLRLAFAAPTDRSPNTMTYDLTLLRQGAIVGRLLGDKYLMDDPGMDAWLDLTTLYARIEPNDGPPLYGVLRIPFATFLTKQLPTFATQGGEDLNEGGKLWALGRFWRLFFGGLGDIYLPEFFPDGSRERRP